MKIFWDTNLFIYLVEKTPNFHDRVVQLRQEMLLHGDVLATSTLTLAELLVQPLRQGNHELVNLYKKIFYSPRLILLSLDTKVAEQVAEIRARHQVRTPDAIQLASASILVTDRFYTSDRSLWGKRIEGIGEILGLE